MVNPYVLSLILGIVEGLTEFLPVSSTAHLRLTEAILGNSAILSDSYWKMYSIVIQLGAVLCLPIYFRKRILKFLGTFPRGERGDRNVFTHPLSLTIVAFITTALPAWRLTKVIGKNLESLYVMGTALLVGGIVMWVIDSMFGRLGDTSEAPAPGLEAVGAGGVPVAPEPPPPAHGNDSAAGPFAGFHRTDHMEEMSLPQAVWIGAAQISSAVFPGTSRSMSTIAAGQIAGMSRPAALEFSFFLSIPTMAVATGYDFLKSVILHKGSGPGETLPPIVMDMQKWIILAIGFVLSFLVAWVVVAWFMSWVRRRGFMPFAIYRIILGLAVLAWAGHHGG